MRKMYYFWITIFLIPIFLFREYLIEILFGYILVYRPILDYIYIRKMELHSGKRLFLKYPFWGFHSKLLFG